MKRKLIRVTKSHIEKGKKDYARSNVSPSCPIALAMIGSKFKGVRVYRDSVCFSFKENRYYYEDLPDNAQEFIKNFDEGEETKPFNFYLNYGKNYESKRILFKIP